MVYCLYWVFVCVCCAAPDKLTSPPPFTGLGALQFERLLGAYDEADRGASSDALGLGVSCLLTGS